MFSLPSLVRDVPIYAVYMYSYVDILFGILGLVLLPSFVSPEEQRALVRWSLKDHARHPNETNLDTHYLLPSDGLWNKYVDSAKNNSPEEQIQPRASLLGTSSLPDQNLGPRQLISNEPASKDNIVPLTNTPKLPAPPSLSVKPSPVTALIPKLRWANIGWYYHWGTKQYDFTRGKIEVSPVVTDICKCAVNAVPWSEVHDSIDDSNDWAQDEHWSGWKNSYGKYRRVKYCTSRLTMFFR